jgi:hypothetical protein
MTLAEMIQAEIEKIDSRRLRRKVQGRFDGIIEALSQIDWAEVIETFGPIFFAMLMDIETDDDGEPGGFVVGDEDEGEDNA